MSNRRTAFTLAELMVTISVLALMMTLAGRVFSIAVESTNQATALMDISQSIRLLEESLRADLRGVNPDRSLMVIDTHSVNAYWTADGQLSDENGDPTDGYPHVSDPEREEVGSKINGSYGPPWPLEHPRADVLMFFTTGSANSAIYPAVRGSSMQVVYGHAELGELNSDGTWAVEPLSYPVVTTADPDPAFWDSTVTLQDRFYAQNWHLARRTVLMVDASSGDLMDLFGIDVEKDLDRNPVDFELDQGSDAPFAFRDAELDFIPRDDATVFDFNVNVLNGDMKDFATNPTHADALKAWYRRSRLDETPPALMSDRLAHYLLPHCASFKVEWALTDPLLADEGEIVWVDPSSLGDSIVAQVRHFRDKATAAGNFARATDLENRAVAIENGTGAFARFDPTVPPPDGTTHAFFARDPDPDAVASDPDPFFPKALRITVDVYDSSGRFARPIRHVMVLPVGDDG